MLRVLVVLFLMAFSALVGLFVFTRPSLRVVQSWTSPDKQFTLAVVQSDNDYRGLPFDVRPRYGVYVGRQPEPVYGHWVDYSFTSMDVEKDIQACQVEWSDQGARLTAPSGHILFIPRKWYEAGR